MEPLAEAGLDRREVLAIAGVSVRVMDSVALASEQDRGQVIITGSHGGSSAGEYAMRCGCRAFACNDAGFGKNDAGVAGLRALERAGIVGVAVSHTSARIGDGVDAWEHGFVSFVNAPARDAGFTVGGELAGQVRAYLSGGA
jgi:hypothetical protein